MTFGRATRKVAAIIALFAFLSQSALALGAGHTAHPAPPVAPVVHHAAVDAHHHAAPHHHGDAVAAEAMSAGDVACDDDRGCLCCIGSCASVLPAWGGVSPAAPPPACSLPFEPGFLFSRDATTPYRPPTAL